MSIVFKFFGLRIILKKVGLMYCVTELKCSLLPYFDFVISKINTIACILHFVVIKEAMCKITKKKKKHLGIK